MTTAKTTAQRQAAAEIQAAPPSWYNAKDKAFHAWWYGHMKNDLMQPPLANVSHSEARYIWDAARKA